jgi:hypothetical protein
MLLADYTTDTKDRARVRRWQCIRLHRSRNRVLDVSLAKDDKRAAELSEQGCDGGDRAGCLALGFMYQYGQGVVAILAYNPVGKAREKLVMKWPVEGATRINSRPDTDRLRLPTLDVRRALNFFAGSPVSSAHPEVLMNAHSINKEPGVRGTADDRAIVAPQGP